MEKIIKVTKKEQKQFDEISKIHEERSRLIRILSQINNECADKGVRVWDDLIKKYELDPTKKIYYDNDKKEIHQKEKPEWPYGAEREEAEREERYIKSIDGLTGELKRQNDLVKEFDFLKKKKEE